jgi:3-methylcrotonyl-CoA carboxylase alpha subunit
MRKVLVANRGEIACRVMRSCQRLGLGTVAVYSDADKDALHVVTAGEARPIGPPPAKDSYLAAEKLVGAARDAGADAVHPGYGFLAENSQFARAVMAAGLTWIGPTPQTIEDMGDKERARLLAQAAGVPVLPGSARFTPDNLHGLDVAGEAVGYPLLVKAAAGGGGIGMRRVDRAADLEKTVTATQTFAEKSFGDASIYLERFVEPARHVEIQVFGFGDGRAVHLFERECSIQRRFQKIIEESPSPGITPQTRTAMARCAAALAAQERYAGAGTVEFVADEDGAFYFLEMNTRIQVEHPVTEMTTGLDLVELQIRLARGEDLSDLTQERVAPAGHAIECRIYAENPARNFMPAPGPLTVFAPPVGLPGIRIDAGFRQGDKISFYYDPMIAKVIAHGGNRSEAVARLDAALAQFNIEGLMTNIAFLRRVLAHPDFQTGRTFTRFVDNHMQELM